MVRRSDAPEVRHAVRTITTRCPGACSPLEHSGGDEGSEVRQERPERPIAAFGDVEQAVRSYMAVPPQKAGQAPCEAELPMRSILRANPVPPVRG
jgi:hypothetical protein